MFANDEMLVLIVDDNANNLKVLGSILSLHKYKIALACNGNECLAMIAKQIPDLIFLDIMMPGINGFEVCKTIKSNKSTAHVPVIFVSALSSPSQVNKAFESGGVDYITKPFNKDEILARARVHLQIKNERDILLEKIKKLESENNRPVKS
jgi:two-component system sensor histidine kinase/response regulator